METLPVWMTCTGMDGPEKSGDSPSLEIFQNSLDIIPCGMLWAVEKGRLEQITRSTPFQLDSVAPCLLTGWTR